MHRFYQPDVTAPTLADAEAHHALHVLRLRAGDEVEIFDGRGNAVRYRIAEATKRQLRLTPLAWRTSPALPVRITLATAIIKKNFDVIIQKATELGAAAIVPLVTERTIVRTGNAARWREIALEACKQCGNNWLPDIAAPQSLGEFLTAGTFDLKLIAALQPDARPLKSVLGDGGPRFGVAVAAEETARARGSAPLRSVCVLVGPEGDFSPAEYAAARAAGYQPITLGPLVLRADTATLYALSIVHHELVTHGNVC